MDSKLARIKSKARWHGGAVLVEYSLILAFVAVPAIIGIIAGGVSMLNEYR